MVLLRQYPNIPVYGPQEVAEFANVIVSPEQHISLFGYDVRIIESGGHTAGHISYLFGYDYLFVAMRYSPAVAGGFSPVITKPNLMRYNALKICLTRLKPTRLTNTPRAI